MKHSSYDVMTDIYYDQMEFVLVSNASIKITHYVSENINLIPSVSFLRRDMLSTICRY